MKNSGIEWIGQIPADWEYSKLKHFYAFEKGTNAAIYTQEYIGQNVGEYPVYSGQTENDGVMGKINSYDYDVEECLFTTTVGAKVMTPKILRGKFSLSQNCLIMKKIKECNNSFMYYTLISLFDYEKKMIPTYMQPSLRMEDLRKYALYLPTLTEQKKIADFLDSKVSEIDKMIAETKSSIENYKEYKQSIITEAVTKGLNKDVQMKDSGIEWISEIPAHWNVNMLSQIFYQHKCKNKNLEENNLLSLSYGKIKRKDINVNEGLLPESFDNYNIIDANDIVLRLTDLQNDHKSLRVGLATEKGIITSAYVTLRSKNKMDTKYFYYYLHTFDVHKGFYGMGCGVRQGLNFEELRKLKILYPCVEEQKKIVDFLDEKCSQIDTLVEEKEIFIATLEEYKKSLIYEYVTGKKLVL